MHVNGTILVMDQSQTLRDTPIPVYYSFHSQPSCSVNSLLKIPFTVYICLTVSSWLPSPSFLIHSTHPQSFLQMSTTVIFLEDFKHFSVLLIGHSRLPLACKTRFILLNLAVKAPFDLVLLRHTPFPSYIMNPLLPPSSSPSSSK